MGTEIEKTLGERIKDFLGIEGEHSIFELADLLRQFRNESHPDNFQGEELKQKAEERFKSAQALLEEFETQMELDRFNRKPTELTRYKPLYDAVQLQSDLDKTKNELRELNSELEKQRRANATLDVQLQETKDESLTLEIQHLQSIYKPSTQRYASFGLAIVLSATLGIMSQMERVSGVLQRHSPLPVQFVGTSLFICLILLLASMGRKVWEHAYIKRKSEEVCSPKCAKNFLEYLKLKRQSKATVPEFSEVDAFDFLEGNKSYLKDAATMVGFSIFRPETVNQLKNIFLHNLLNKKLITLSRAQEMQRYFAVSTTESDVYWYHRYTEEKVKNELLSSNESK